ncbi:MAG: ABC transporter ATP-binding protein [Verrucomicrobiales bacterium]|nr:ABC transporter ATP-binding protein [Verrucomicrobiales bacterium]
MNEPSATPLLTAKDLRKTYQMGRRSVEVLRGASLEVAKGEFVALRGASGSGKSTLLHLLGGLDLPDSGRIEFRGESLDQWGAARLARFRNQQVGFVFQAYHLLPELDATENVSLPARILRQPAAEAAERARLLLERVGLGKRLDHLPTELSGGEQQRVAIARALINRPPLVLADEPTGNLDSATGGDIMDLLASLQSEEGMTLILVTHDPRVAGRAPKVLELVDGVVGERASGRHG